MQSSSPFILSFLLLLTLPLFFLHAPRILPPKTLPPKSLPPKSLPPIYDSEKAEDLALFLHAPRILPPETLPPIFDSEEAEDLALFHRATLSSADAVGGASTRRHPPSPPKIAFMFLVNSDIAFAPLWELFFRGHERLFNVYVHADPAAELKLQPSKSFKDRFILAKPTRRASPTLISAARRLLAAALLDDPANAFFALVSQHCIPLHSFRYVYHALLGPPGPRRLSFIEIISDDPGLRTRYRARGDDVMLPEIPFERFRVGSQFFVLARRHALLVVRDRRLWKRFRLPCLKEMINSCYPEEHYFPTLLDMEDPGSCSRYTLTRVNWTHSVSGHPHTYFPPEISRDLIHELRKLNSSYSYLFARKFSPDCLQPLLRIAKSVIFRD